MKALLRLHRCAFCGEAHKNTEKFAIFIQCPINIVKLNTFVPHSTDTQSLARDTPYCARSTLDIVVQVR